MGKEYRFVIFQSTNSVMKAEKLLIKAGLSVKLIPVPRNLSSDCGICIQFEISNIEKIRQILDSSKTEYTIFSLGSAL